MHKKASITLFVVLLSMVCITLSMLTAYSYWKAEKNDSIADFIHASDELNYRLQRELSDVINIAANNSLLAAKSPLLQSSIQDPSYLPALKKSWENMFTSAPSLYQIRFLNANGVEVFRGNRSQNDIEWVVSDNLQDKSDRSYFIKGMDSSNLIYLSKIDLNIEKGVLEKPYRPTIRASAKFYDNGKIAGLVVLNFDLSQAFTFFDQQQTLLTHWILNQEGYFISSPDNSEWGWLIGAPELNAKTKFPQIFERVKQGQMPLEDGYYARSVTINTNLSDVEQSETEFYVVSSLSEQVYAELQTKTYVILLALLLVILLIIFVAKYISGIALAMHKSEALAVHLAHKARESERTKANFLAQMSHEIRTPMNGMYGLLQLTRGERDYHKINKYLEQAVGSFKVLKRIIDDILDFSKIEAGKLELVKENVRLDATLRDVAQIMGRAGYGKNLDIWIDIAPNCPREVIGDAVRVNQIIFNLTNNAIKFTENGEIKLKISLKEESAEDVVLAFAVSDTGIGMSSQEISQVFDAFTQASNATHSKFGGTGLGLSIVKQLIELMDGDINIQSTPNVGTKIEFCLRFGKVANSRRFSELADINDEQFTEALLLNFAPTALEQVQKQCSILGWPTVTIDNLESVDSICGAKHSKRQILIIDESAIGEPLANEIMAKCSKLNGNMLTVLVANYGSDNLESLEQTAFDTAIVKPFTPSTLYDAVVSITDDANVSKTPLAADNQSITVLAGKNILLVEDNEINQIVIGAMLEGAGAKIEIANHGGECLDWLKIKEFDLICMDVQMPVMDGLETAQCIRKNKRYDGMPIVALTANAQDEDRNMCFDAGMQGYVTKPIERTELINVLQGLLLSSEVTHTAEF